MADGELTIRLTEYAKEKLAKRAADAGLTPEDIAAAVLEQQLLDYDDFEWDVDQRAVEPDLEDEAGPTYSAEQVMGEFRRRMAARLARKA